MPEKRVGPWPPGPRSALIDRRKGYAAGWIDRESLFGAGADSIPRVWWEIERQKRMIGIRGR